MIVKNWTLFWAYCFTFCSWLLGFSWSWQCWDGVLCFGWSPVDWAHCLGFWLLMLLRDLHYLFFLIYVWFAVNNICFWLFGRWQTGEVVFLHHHFLSWCALFLNFWLICRKRLHTALLSKVGLTLRGNLLRNWLHLMTQAPLRFFNAFYHFDQLVFAICDFVFYLIFAQCVFFDHSFDFIHVNSRRLINRWQRPWHWWVAFGISILIINKVIAHVKF